MSILSETGLVEKFETAENKVNFKGKLATVNSIANKETYLE